MGRRLHARAALGLLALAAAPPALAIVGGREGGALPASTVMVLSDHGGVCTGIVVAPAVVLTAGHCAASAAGTRVHYPSAGTEPVLIQPQAVSRHPGYQGDAVASRRTSIDLALVRLPAPLPARFVPAALDDGPQPRAGEAVTVSGYGVSREGDGTSSGRDRQAALTIAEPYGPGKILLWASGAPGSGACQGDSGGPMTRAGSPAVVGVTAWSTGAKGARCGALTQAIRLGAQRGWIDAIAANWGAGLSWTMP